MGKISHGASHIIDDNENRKCKGRGLFQLGLIPTWHSRPRLASHILMTASVTLDILNARGTGHGL